MKKILVTGATGFIGSHTVVELLDAGYDVVGVDSFVNSKAEVLDRLEQITGKRIAFYEGDVRDRALLDRILAEHPDVVAAIHFAGLKAVGESVEKPLEYYDNNLQSTLTLCMALRAAGCKRIIFSSSATVYGTPEQVPLQETSRTGGTTNPYGTTKLMCERILSDLHASDEAWSVGLLRYFNPVGAHASGLIGEEPNGIPNNLMPYVLKVAAGVLPRLNVFGGDYPTPDGTGVRDFIHVVDLAKGHVAMLTKLLAQNGVHIYNLGTGHGYSVLDLVKTFERVNGVPVPYVMAPRRAGDLAENYADPSKAAQELGWRAQLTLEDMCRDAWHFAVTQGWKR